ncbi:hypothetical protein [Hymenobacter chitinivorans]|uniref:Uncharacterized protein n=1 Tax=Hymenobacter chitinivorans DSM 11115 TaxID=1121954 RepID=A0A2M9BSG0_9BACT|nr:hypothetical protein [Hymenobacter chitinivorans]PJJ60886.1 hypothetical protein CLV45_2321 [Hymenobacter chitinivorans DSM 11115]
MTETRFSRLSRYCTLLVTVAIWALLAWSHFHGGVPSHHFLAQQELPAVSNGWGGLLLPVLTWLLLSRIRQRVFGPTRADSDPTPALRRALYGFAGALLFGVLISGLFTAGEPDMAGNVMLGLFALAFFVPIYRPECLLGFVLAMTYTFGAVLPTIIGTVLGLIGWVVYGVIRRGLVYVGAKILQRLPATQ